MTLSIENGGYLFFIKFNAFFSMIAKRIPIVINCFNSSLKGPIYQSFN